MSRISRRQFVASFGGLVVAARGGLSRIDALNATRLPDLVITSLSGYSGAVPGQAVSFVATVKNQGTAATPSGIVIGVGFHIDGTEVSWSAYDKTSLAVGASVSLKADGGPNASNGTWPATAGTHTLLAMVNDVQRFSETSYSNNSYTTSFSVGSATVTKPVNVTPPVITGTPQVGSVLSVSNGTWS